MSTTLQGQTAVEPVSWHALETTAAAETLGVPASGLTSREVARQIARFGPNKVEPPEPPSRWSILLRQFQSPLIYVLEGAALLALALGEFSDAGFIAAVLLVNALIGFINEAKADREVRALSRLVRTRARVFRDGHATEIDSEQVVPGDALLLESGMRVSADARLSETHGLRMDESLLTGESVPVAKEADDVLAEGTPLAERQNMVFAGTVVATGRGLALAVATGASTEVGAIATQLATVDPQPPPLILRMHRFARVIGWAAIGLAAFMVAVGLALRQPFTELLLSAVALAVSAVPEGLPIALTVALSVAVARMSRRGVVVRHLPAVEGLGSCAVIATDKTGTLTRNQLTVERLVTGGHEYTASGIGYAPIGELCHDGRSVILAEDRGLFRLLRAVCLANEASLVQVSAAAAEWEWSGDPTDVALLSAALKGGCDPTELAQAHRPVASIPFESERRYAASFHEYHGGGLVCVKGAPEQVLEMCDVELAGGNGGSVPLDRTAAHAAVRDVMRAGYRVLAVADAETSSPFSEDSAPSTPSGLVYLGLVAMTDPPRDGVPDAIARCHDAGIHVLMITGDHATTAAAIAERIGMAPADSPVLEGAAISAMTDDELMREIHQYHVVARATPADKLRVVKAWQSRGAYVGVTGDGVNDAPALRQANLGIAMGKSGTDVAREAAELVITDDNFASIVGGVEEGRVAYDNVRKVTYLLVSTGLGEVLLVISALALGLGLPMTAVQLLWLNLVTNGIQDVALALEAGEPGALNRPPRPSRERIFNRLMIERTVLAGLVFGGIGLWSWNTWLAAGMPVAEARNLLVQLFVLFEIFHIGNSRSETTSMFRLSPLRNPLLVAGTGAALGIHLVAMYTPALQRLIGVSPITLNQWMELVLYAAPILVIMEMHKWARNRWPVRLGAVQPRIAQGSGAG
jgi:magnesium-transporting ATPase (P-type)